MVLEGTAFDPYGRFVLYAGNWLSVFRVAGARLEPAGVVKIGTGGFAILP